MTFDWTISIGGVIEGLAILVTLLGLHVSNRERFTRLETKVDLMWQTWLLRNKDKVSEEGQ